MAMAMAMAMAMVGREGRKEGGVAPAAAAGVVQVPFTFANWQCWLVCNGRYYRGAAWNCCTLPSNSMKSKQRRWAVQCAAVPLAARRPPKEP